MSYLSVRFIARNYQYLDFIKKYPIMRAVFLGLHREAHGLDAGGGFMEEKLPYRLPARVGRESGQPAPFLSLFEEGAGDVLG
ncbi:MAG: hypothetical protein AB7J40_06355 [Candidatus Altimarinota bacterium]